ncbi:RluA family pseudouridine synthase [Anaerocellum diazotrophicum]|uniref:RNA pseudouridylate synthase n=1 Tax=Caldicellulosiruptor diazotrophicus TaxID=2806205 RepID=A0ABN6E8P1_9FIRM|nr:RluA family pseudouridine synthase [Caldicellulosiruptor diazotrophicus]BCS80994.1 tRNA pseudouridine synthase A [Caldicellulosiruptor diazotrophicus]
MVVNFVVDKELAGVKVEKAIKKKYPTIPMSVIFKMLRRGEVIVSLLPAQRGQVLRFGDTVSFEIEERFLEYKKVEILKVYEDDNIVVIDKPYGIPSHPDSNNEYSVVNWIEDNYSSKEELPQLCHRLDRNTAGLMIVAKNRQVLSEMLKYMSRRAIIKKYLCITKKADLSESGVLVHYLKKDSKKSKVYISDFPQDGYSEVVTAYKIVRQKDDLQLVDVEIKTGKTHQIRSQLAHVGLCILGDNKYGDWKLNKKYKAEMQALCAYYLKFEIGKKGVLRYLDGQKIVKETVEFPVDIEGFSSINVYKERGLEI